MTELSGPFCLDIEPARGLAQGAGQSGLSFLGQKPVEEYFSRIWMRRVLEQDDVAATRGRVITFFDRRYRLDRQACFDKRNIRVIGETDRDRGFAASDVFAELA